MITGRIVTIYANGTVQVRIDQTRQLVTCDPFTIFNDNTGLQYGPSIDDIVFLDDFNQIGALIVHARASTAGSRGRPAIPPDGTRTLLQEGELIIYAKGGQQIYLDTLGNIRLLVPTNGIIQLGNSNLHWVARDGDSVVGTDSRGGAISAHVVASSRVTEAQ